MRRQFTCTPHQIDKLNRVEDILKELSPYKPLTLRQVYYQLVGKGIIENKVSEYSMLSGLIKHARLAGYIAWEDIEDRVRAFHDLTGWQSADSFKTAYIKQFLTGYRRNLMQSQVKYIEIWIEKDALSSIFTRIADRFTVPVVVCRGFTSISFLNDYKQRIAAYPDKTPVLLYFGDFDPSGIEMLRAMQVTLEDELQCPGVVFKRVALKKEDVYEYHLPHSPEALKKTDTRAKKHVSEYGELAVELDALRPDALEQIITDAIVNEIDTEAFNQELNYQRDDMNILKTIKDKVNTLI